MTTIIDEQFDALLFTWEDSTENFMLWIEHMCGVEIESATYQTLKENVTDVSDVQKWIEQFDGNLDGVAYTTEAFMALRGITA